MKKGKRTNSETDPQAAHLGMRMRLVHTDQRTSCRKRREGLENASEEDPRGGGTRLFDPMVEVEATDLASVQGVVVELKDGLHGLVWQDPPEGS